MTNTPICFMQNFLISLVLIFCASSLYGQLFYLGYPKDTIIADYSGPREDGEQITFSEDIVNIKKYWTIDEVETYDTIVSLKVLSESSSGSFEIDFFFDEDFYSCDSLVFNMECNDCIDVIIQEFLDEKRMKWKKLNEDEYISTKAVARAFGGGKPKIGSIRMNIIRNIKGKMCTRVHLYIAMIEAKKWRKLIKS
ncbi:MAG: hypothetical protein GY810_24740 [Aureispira sp.]|nr:hypothetical protein [Aureispira sp.]